VLLQSLAILAGDDIGSLDPEGAEVVHLAVEAMKLAYADREAYYGDPAFVPVPLDTLLSPAYADARRRLLSTTEASNACAPGAVPGHECAARSVAYDAACARVAETGLLGRYGGGEPTFARLDAEPQPFVGDTCTLEVADRFGNMVAATPSGGWLQSSPVIPELGFPLGTRAQSMSLDPAAPSALAPGRRPRTTLSPTLVLDGEGARLAMGTPGGDQQDQWQLVFLLRHLDHGYDLQRAAEAPSFHSEHWPNSFYPRHARRRRLVLGGRWSEAVRADLAGRGHDVQVGEPWTEGRIAAVGRDGPLLTAGASPRGMQNYAAGR
jgi:gamma-glutamyltranspeptidase/glutathione hydrolase